MKLAMKTTVLICAFCVAQAANAQDDAAAALADCQAHQQRLEELEATYTPPAEPSNGSPVYTPQQFGENDLEHERVLTERACNYAKALRQKPGSAQPKARAIERQQPFRSDVPAPAAPPAVAPPPQAAPPPPPARPVVRRPPPAPADSSNVGGTKARHPASDDAQSPQ